nr:MAG TPA: DNA polymerase phi [Caudoviricetes sp.]
MATKLTANVAKRVKALGINATTDEAARPKLLEILEENGIEQMDDEDITTLVEIAESFVDADADGDDEGDEEAENDALAEEVEEEEKPKKGAKKATKKAEPEPEEDEDEEEEGDDDEESDEDSEEGDELDDMDRGELKDYIKENELEITVKKSWSDDDIREKIREAMGDEEDEEEDEAPAPKKNAKTAVAPKKEEKKADKKEAPKASAKKEDKPKADKKATAKRGNKLDPKNNEEDRKHFDFLKKLFPEKDYIYAWVASAGVTIKYKGKNSNRSLISLENCTLKGEGKNAVMTCNLYLLIFNGKYEALEKAEVEYEKCWSGAPMLKAIEVSEAVEVIESLKDEMDKMVGGIDKKLGDNRKKMEEGLKKDKKAAGKASSKKASDDEEEEDEDEEEQPKAKAKPAAKKASKKVEVEEDEEDEDDEEEAPAPKKKATSKTATKKTVNKKK